MGRNISGFITFYLILRVFRTGMVGIAFIIKVFGMYFNNIPASEFQLT